MGTSSADVLQLVWDNHLANISALFESLYREHKLVDVTLACRDGHLRAHKLVLSACSPFFERIFQENPCDHPVVIVRGVYYQEMQTLLDYIYKGRISIAANLVNDLVCVASDLEIKGFESFREIGGMNNGRDEGMQGYYQKQKPCPSSFVTTVMPTKAQKKLNYDQLSHFKTPIDNDQPSCSDNDEAPPSGSPELVCAVCYYKTRSRNDLLQHRLLHEQLERQHMCEYCPASFARSSHLARHRRSHTGERPFTCYCGKNFARQDKLKSHIRKNHSSGAAGSASGSQMSQTLFMSNGLQLMATNQPKPESLMLLKSQIKMEPSTAEPPAKRRRGRPRKGSFVEVKPKRGRGRPRKKALFPVLLQKKDVVNLVPPIPGIKRGRGRPRKIPLVPLFPPNNPEVELPSATAIKKEPDDPQTVVPLFEVSLEPQIELLEDSGPDKRASDVAKVEPFLEYDPLLMVPQSTADYSTITTITQSVSTGDRMSLTSLTSSS